MDNETVKFFRNGDVRIKPYKGFIVGLTGTVELDTGASGSVDGISVDGVEIMSGANATAIMSSVASNTFATGTATVDTILAGTTLTANGLVFTAVAGIKTDFTEFSVLGTDGDVASDLAHSIHNDTRSGTSGDISASSSGAVATMTTDVSGTGGNAITLVSSSGTELAVSGSGTFTGGVTAETLTVNGNAYTCVSDTPSDFTEFSNAVDDDATATSLAAAINGDTRAGTLDDVTATATTDTVTMTQTVGGQGGNATTLAETGAGITISGATFDGAEAFDTSLTVTAANVAANINAITTVPNYSATSAVGLITIKIESDHTAVDGLTVASEVTTIATTDVNMGVDTGNLEKSAGTLFISLAELVTFLRANTGA